MQQQPPPQQQQQQLERQCPTNAVLNALLGPRLADWGWTQSSFCVYGGLCSADAVGAFVCVHGIPHPVSVLCWYNCQQRWNVAGILWPLLYENIIDMLMDGNVDQG
jgi:hypothetical protein